MVVTTVDVTDGGSEKAEIDEEGVGDGVVTSDLGGTVGARVDDGKEVGSKPESPASSCWYRSSRLMMAM